MALINPLSDIKKYSPLGSTFKMFWGRVIDNRDPKMLQRIKVQIQGLLPFETADKLPWFYPLHPIGTGQGPLSGSQSIPEIDSFIVITFPNESIYSGFYIGTMSDRLRRLPDLLSEYPERYGTIDSRENKHIVNKAPRVDSTETRYSDGVLKIQDSKESINYYTDRYGTKIIIDRRNQHAIISFGGIRITIKDGSIKFIVKDFHIQAFEVIRFISKKWAELLGKSVVQIMGKIVGVASKASNKNDIH